MSLERNIAVFVLSQRTDLRRLGRARLPRVPESVFLALEASFFQRQIVRRYQQLMQQEWEQLVPHMSARATRILDIGCGIGGIDEFVYRTYSCCSPTIELHLADRERADGGTYYGFRSIGAAYNSLALSRSYLRARGVPNEVIHTIDVDQSALPEQVKFDTILSLLSWGFHYPVETYLAYAKGHLATGGVVILDVRANSGGIEALNQSFSVTVVREHPKYVRVKCQTD